MPHEEALGGQRTPHGGLGVFGGLLVAKGFLNAWQVGIADAATLVDADIRHMDILHGVARQTSDATAIVAGIPYVYIINV